jgi:ribonuclease G
MSKEILVNVDLRETRIAVLDDQQLVELHVEREQRVVGNVYKAKVDNVLQGMDAAFVEIGLERNAFLYVADILPEDDEDGGGRFRGRDRRDLHIKDLVSRGDQLLVQVVKGPRGTKGSRVSTRISLPGRFLVLMPEANNLGVSRKIDDGKERDRLKKE